jgi:hypothetical protein
MSRTPADVGTGCGAAPFARVSRSQITGRPGVRLSRRHTARAVTCGALFLLSCASPTPDEVWVRDPAFPARLRIWLDEAAAGSLRVGRWIDLHADRSTGRWIRVASKDLEPDVRWLAQPPPAEEVGVESNVRWFVEPDGFAEFNLPTAGDLLSRRVRFTAPGNYVVWSQSHSWGGDTVRSNQINVAIRP